MKDEILIYQADELSTRFEVRIEDETLWMTQSQIVNLFDSSKANISEHIKHIFTTGELNENTTVRFFRTVQKEGKRTVSRDIVFYSLDVIISVGYRVNSIRGTQFRIWANKVLKEYLLKGYSVNKRIDRIEDDVQILKEKTKEFDLQIKTSLPPNQGIFYEGQIFDAHVFVSGIIKSAKKTIILVDNYIDESVLIHLAKREKNVKAVIYTSNFTKQLQLDVKKHNEQYPKIEIKTFSKAHDRFLIIDNQEIYHIGASLKDLGKKWFAFSKIMLNTNDIINKLNNTN
ncbi:MAG: DNA-binding protein [Bacteroidetes bacterium GWA2_31_9]|nr:MAG: DNA-binding protein [Bacteroidetes bacterium GWA2_31_9]